MINYFKHRQIDKNKWDKLISDSQNPSIYGLSWYLDSVCPEWDAFIMNDYEAVMPVPFNKFLGFKYIQHPFFTQQLGVFYKKNCTEEFLEALNKKFSSYILKLNEKNQIETNVKGMKYELMPNYVLNLNDKYEIIKSRFSSNTSRNLNKALKNNLHIKDVDVNDIIKLERENTQFPLKAFHYRILSNLLNNAVKHKMYFKTGVYDSQNNLLAAVFFMNAFGRSIYLIPVSSEKGKELRAMFFLVNDLIKNNSEKNLLLDFEGSSIEGVATFYKGFGAVNCPYPKISGKKKLSILF